MARVSAGGSSLAVAMADSFVLRLAGLAGLGAFPAGAGLLIPRCGWVHTWGMRFDIDVVFLAWPPRPDCAVLALERAVRPWRSVPLRGRPAEATAVLEAPSGALERLLTSSAWSVTVASTSGRPARM